MKENGRIDEKEESKESKICILCPSETFHQWLIHLERDHHLLEKAKTITAHSMWRAHRADRKDQTKFISHLVIATVHTLTVSENAQLIRGHEARSSCRTFTGGVKTSTGSVSNNIKRKPEYMDVSGLHWIEVEDERRTVVVSIYCEIDQHHL